MSKTDTLSLLFNSLGVNNIIYVLDLSYFYLQDYMKDQTSWSGGKVMNC